MTKEELGKMGKEIDELQDGMNELGQKNRALIEFIESSLKSDDTGRKLIRDTTEILDKEAEVLGTLTKKIVEYRKQILETPDMNRLTERMEEQKKKTDQMEQEVKDAFSNLEDKVGDLRGQQ